MTEEVLAKSYDTTPYKEYEASAAIEPGMVLRFSGTDSDGTPQVAPTDTVDETSPGTLVAREQRMPPRTGTGSPREQAYASGDNVECYQLQKGDEAYLLLAAGADLSSSSNANVAVTDKLGVNDDGTLKVTTTTGAEVFRPQEAVDNSGASAGENVFIRVEVL